MQIWQDILATAVVGTEQQELVPVSPDDEIGRLLAQISNAERESYLLPAASLVALYQRAGFAAASDGQPVPEACEADVAMRGSAAAGQHLALMLAGEFKEVLPEWLVALHRAGKRIPEEHLPAMLDMGRAEVPWRGLISAALGKRGEWLAAQNPDWTYATRRDHQQVWETGSRDERLLLLGNLRATDANMARELVAATWQQESARDRAAFLEKLATGVTDDDELFLSEALHDRSVEVRRVARAILARLPDSQFSRRLKELTTQVVTLKKPLLVKARVEVSLPDDPMGWLKEHGIELDGPPRDSPYPSVGPKGWYLKEMIALVPIAHWVESWGKSPAEIIKAAFESEWERSFSDGFVLALRRDRNPDWIEALLTHWLYDQKKHTTQSALAEPAAWLPVARLEALIQPLLKADAKGLHDTHPALGFLLAHQGDWSNQLSRATMQSIKTRITRTSKDASGDWQTRAALKQFARHVAPSLYDELIPIWPRESEAWPAWSKSVDAFQSLLAFRRDMHKAILAKE
jgi:hypothetical protein